MPDHQPASAAAFLVVLMLFILRGHGGRDAPRSRQPLVCASLAFMFALSYAGGAIASPSGPLAGFLRGKMRPAGVFPPEWLD